MNEMTFYQCLTITKTIIIKNLFKVGYNIVSPNNRVNNSYQLFTVIKCLQIYLLTYVNNYNYLHSMNQWRSVQIFSGYSLIEKYYRGQECTQH